MAFLGIDVGTSATKAVVVDASGAVLAVASAPHAIARPAPGWSEQDPDDWWAAVQRASREACAGHEIEAVGLSGQMHGSVLLDGVGAVVRPALLWNDQRTAAQCARIERDAGGRAALIAEVGNAALPGFTLPKLLWVRDAEPGLWARVRSLLMPKDYIACRLTGERATDVGDASGTLLFDVDARAWHAGAVARSGLDPALLPPVHESGEVIGRVRDGAAIGVADGVPVSIGSGDNQAGAIGAGVVEPGMVLVTLGTSGVVYAHAGEPRRDDRGPTPGRLHTMCAADGRAGVRGHWSMTGCTLSAGGALAWARALLAPEERFETLVTRALESVPAGARGAAFLPHLTGERCPYADADARGAWVGLTARHGRDELIRAVVEGVTFSVAAIADLMREAGVRVTRVRVGGGAASNAAWRALLADAIGVPVVVPTTTEGPAYGAALCAMVGVGRYASAREACGACVRDSSVTEPSATRADALAPARSAWGRLHADLRAAHGALGAIDAGAAGSGSAVATGHEEPAEAE